MDPKSIFARLEAQYGLPSGYLDGTWAVESSRRTGAIKAPTSSAAGPFQFTDGTARQMGLAGDDRFDLAKSAEAAARLGQGAVVTLSKLGLPVNAATLYLVHQQGATGATALLKAPAERAVDVLTRIYRNPSQAAAAIKNNGGNLDMSAGDFANHIASIYYRKSGQQAPQTPGGASPQNPQRPPDGGFAPSIFSYLKRAVAPASSNFSDALNALVSGDY